MLRRVENIPRLIQRNFKKKGKKQKHWRPTVGIIVTRAHKVLFVQSLKNGTWGPPKGGIEKKDFECIVKAAFRELFEELGLRPALLKLLGYLGSVRDERNYHGKQIGKYFHMLHMKICPTAKPEANREENIAHWRWIGSLKEFDSLKMKPRRRRIWLAALRKAKVPWAMKN